MIDSDDVLLLRPVDPRSGFALSKERPPVTASQPPVTASQPGSSLVVATIYLLPAPVDDDFRWLFEGRVAPLMAATGAPSIARFQTE